MTMYSLSCCSDPGVVIGDGVCEGPCEDCVNSPADCGLCQHTNQTYACDPEICTLPDCHCPSLDPPNPVTTCTMPQFVLLSVDGFINTVDAANLFNFMDALEASDAVQDAQGCKPRLTTFLATGYTDFYSAQRRACVLHFNCCNSRCLPLSDASRSRNCWQHLPTCGHCSNSGQLLRRMA